VAGPGVAKETTDIKTSKLSAGEGLLRESAELKKSKGLGRGKPSYNRVGEKNAYVREKNWAERERKRGWSKKKRKGCSKDYPHRGPTGGMYS